MFKSNKILSVGSTESAVIELVTAKQLFVSRLKVDDRTKNIYDDFNVEEYVLEVSGKGKIEKNEKENKKDCCSYSENSKKELNNNSVEDKKGKNIDEYGFNSKDDKDIYKEELYFLRMNPLHLNRWYKFLEMYEDEEEIYEQFLLIFPRCVYYWNKYAELKIKKKEYKEAYEIYRKCIDSNIYDLKLFLSFLYFTYHTSSIHEYINFLFEGLKYVGTDIKSGTIWVELLYILIKIYNTNLIANNEITKLLYDPFKHTHHGNRNMNPLIPTEEEQKIYKSFIPSMNNSKISYFDHYIKDGKLRKFYQKWLHHATKYLDKVWKCYCSFEKANDNFNSSSSSSSLSIYNNQYLNSKNAFKELCIIYKEMNVDKKGKIILPINKKWKIENSILYIKWMKIINFEKTNPLKLTIPLVFKRIKYTYEQALIHLQFNSDLWFSYFQYLLLNKKFVYAIRIMREAIEVYLPFDEILKLNFAYFFEKHALINQAHYVYQLMINEVSKKQKKKFALSFLYEKENFRKFPYTVLENTAKDKGKNKDKELKIHVKNEISVKVEECIDDDLSDKKYGNLSDESPEDFQEDDDKYKGRGSRRESKRKKRKGGKKEEVEEEENEEINVGEYINANKRIKMNVTQCGDNKGLLLNDDNNKCCVINHDDNKDCEINHDDNKCGNKDVTSKIGTHLSDDEIRKRFHKSDYEKIEERKKYFVKYFHIKKRKRRIFVFTHFLNFIKRNYDETIWRYYVGLILKEEKCCEEIYYYCANIERRILNNEKRAMYIMNEGYKKFLSKKKFLLFYINFLLEKGYINNIRTLIYEYIHGIYKKFYNSYNENNNLIDKKIYKAKISQSEFNLFEPNYLILLKKKNKSCEKIWNILIHIEILYGDIRNLNKIYDMKIKYDSGYNLEENKHILIDYDTLNVYNEKEKKQNIFIHNFYTDEYNQNNMTNILCKGYLENLKKNDIDTLQFKTNLINSQLFGGISLKKSYSIFRVNNPNVFSNLSFYDYIIKEKKKKKINYNEDNNKTLDNNSMYIKNNRESLITLKDGWNNNNDNIDNNNDNNMKDPYLNKNLMNYINMNRNSTYNRYSIFSEFFCFGIKKDSCLTNIDNNHKRNNEMDEKNDDVNNIQSNLKNCVNYIIRPDLKTMFVYKPFENYEFVETEKNDINKKKRDKETINMSFKDSLYYKHNRNNKNVYDEKYKKEFVRKREYITMPNIINDFLCLLPEQNNNIKLSDNSIDYLVNSLQNLNIPKLENFPYEPIPVKDILQIKNALNE
ncbi:conserved Plasmodium protein, unknown function [Plasmodium sp. DRC-Itaito]|nr:conserved Plasmodium protein, unknown function [Plasmodium sp. DRC-Itaito]